MVNFLLFSFKKIFILFLIVSSKIESPLFKIFQYLNILLIEVFEYCFQQYMYINYIQKIIYIYIYNYIKN